MLASSASPAASEYRAQRYDIRITRDRRGVDASLPHLEEPDVPNETLRKRVEILELKVKPLEQLPEQVAALESQFLQFRTEVLGEFSNVREESRGEFANVREEMRGEFASVREEMRGEFANIRAEMRNEFANVRGEMRGEFANVR